MRSILVIAGLGFFSVSASANDWLDNFRNIDLNDYALGLAVSDQQSPYAGAENSTIVYPFLTSFEHAAFTDKVLVLRDGEVRLRHVTDNDWEFSVAARLETRSFGNHQSDVLSGVSAPEWTLEFGPEVGLRRWPIHVHLAAYFEPTDRHDGIAGRVSISYPRQYARGYVVPEIEAIIQDDSYTEYYYAVTAAEATPERPAYTPGKATNVKFRIVWGYELSEQWLLSGKLGYELLDDSIRASPLVDRDALWSVNVGVAYTPDVFTSSGYDLTVSDVAGLDIRAGIFSARVDTKIGRDTVDGIPGDEIDLEDLFGESENEAVAQIDATWRFNRFHRIEASYFELVRNGSVTLDEELRVADSSFPVGSDLQSRSHFKSIRLGYAYSLMHDSQKEFGLMAGVHFSSFDSVISTTQSDTTEESRLDAPLPVIGAYGSINLGEKNTLDAKLQVFRTDYDHYEGSLNYFSVDLQRRLTEHISAGIGFNYYRLQLRSSQKDLNGYVEIQHHGPVLFFGYRF